LTDQIQKQDPNECPYAQVDYTVSPELEGQLETLHAEDWKPTSQEHDDQQARHELNEESVEKFRLFDDEERANRTNEAARYVNEWTLKELYQRLKSFPCLYPEFRDAGDPGKLGLFVRIRGQESRLFDKNLDKGLKYICFVQYPRMPEWSIFRTDDYGLEQEKYRGWRTIELRLILEGAITEEEGQNLFGSPTLGIVSEPFRKELWKFRNRK